MKALYDPNMSVELTNVLHAVNKAVDLSGFVEVVGDKLSDIAKSFFGSLDGSTSFDKALHFVCHV